LETQTDDQYSGSCVVAGYTSLFCLATSGGQNNVCYIIEYYFLLLNCPGTSIPSKPTMHIAYSPYFSKID